MKKTKLMEKLSVFGMLMVLTAALTGCGAGKEGAATEMHVGYFNNITHAEALLMKAQNKLEDSFGEDIAVKWTAFNAGPAEVEALFAEDIDIGYIGPVPAISANVKSNGDVVVLSSATQGGAVLIIGKDSGIKDVKDLSGKTVAIPQIGNTQHLCLLQLLEDNGLKPVTEGGDVTVSAVANADVANMMERGDIDAALVPEPWGATLLAQGAELLLDYDKVYMDGNYDVAVVVVRKKFMEQNPELVEKFLAEHEAAATQVKDDTENALKIINEELDRSTGKSLSEDIIKEAFTRIGVSTSLNKESMTGFANISKNQDFIKDVPEDSALYAK